MSQELKNNPLWDLSKQFTESLDYYGSIVLNKLQIVDKVKIALYVTWLWAWAGLYTTKIFEGIFTMILSIPDNWLYVPVGSVENTKGQNVHILSAYNNTGEITNKLKLFLKFYWEKGGLEMSHDNNGIDCNSLYKLLNCSILYCSYLLTDKNKDIQPEVFWNNPYQFLVEREINSKNGSTVYYRSYKSDKSDRHRLSMRNLDFEGGQN